MLRLSWGAVLFLLLWLSAWGQPPPPLKLTLHSEPTGANIVDQFGNRLGRTGEAFYLDCTPYKDFIEFNLSLEGYKSSVQTYTVDQLKRFQDKSRVEVLEPLNAWVAWGAWLARHRTALWGTGAGLVLVLLGAGIYVRRVHQALERERLIKKGSATSGGTDSLLASVVGGYLLVEVIGTGGMATVYRGVPKDSLDDGQAVAVKVLGRHQVLADEEEQRFRREINICRGLQHPGIVCLLDYGHHQQFLYLVMELVRGQSLRECLEGSPLLTLQQAWAYLEPIFAAVAYAHKRGVVHRDLKPDNIMVQDGGRVRVLDFGLAKSMDSGKLTATGSILGTPLYIAPEQIQGGPLDPGTDQYSLGVMAYELLSGHLPFLADDALQLIMQHLNQDPQPPSVHRPELLAADPVLLKMLHKDPAQRYSSVLEASQSLREALGV